MQAASSTTLIGELPDPVLAPPPTARWWTGAEFFRSNKNLDDDNEEDDNGNIIVASKSQKTMDKYNADYSRWDSWSPTDPVSLSEIEQQESIENARKMEEFEKANAEFCNQHLEDMKERTKATKKKQESSDVSRLKGNRAFQLKDYDTAMRFYMDALKVTFLEEIDGIAHFPHTTMTDTSWL